MGIGCFWGMIGVTLFGLFLTPVFYVTLMRLGWKKKPAAADATAGPALGPAGAAAGVAVLALPLRPTPAHSGSPTHRPRFPPPTKYLPPTSKATEPWGPKEGHHRQIAH